LKKPMLGERMRRFMAGTYAISMQATLPSKEQGNMMLEAEGFDGLEDGGAALPPGCGRPPAV
jgi:hypothetical protein